MVALFDANACSVLGSAHPALLVSRPDKFSACSPGGGHESDGRHVRLGGRRLGGRLEDWANPYVQMLFQCLGIISQENVILTTLYIQQDTGFTTMNAEMICSCPCYADLSQVASLVSRAKWSHSWQWMPDQIFQAER